MDQPAFVSNAQNGEDVVLWRALGDLPRGRYVEVGANHPLIDSVSRAFYDRGWSGVCVEPLPTFAGELRAGPPAPGLQQRQQPQGPRARVRHGSILPHIADRNWPRCSLAWPSS